MDNAPAPGPARDKTRLLGALAFMALLGVSLVVVVLWQRDSNVIRKSLERVEPYRRAVESALASSGHLPLVLPRADSGGHAIRPTGFTYLPSEDIRYLRDMDGPVMVGYTDPMSSALRTDGRAAVFCLDGRCEGRWVSHAEFAEQRRLQDDWIARRQEELLKAPPKKP